MPIRALQTRARELGRIRIGQKGAKGQPQKLDRFRLTSASQALLQRVADAYGGTVQEWTPKGGTAQWEVVTTSTRLPILVPPQPVTQWLETWTAAGCVHRCDGVTNVLTDEACDPDDPQHQEARPTTRLNVVLRDIEGIGVWRLESHGWNAATELPDAAAFLAQAGGYVTGWLSLEERISKSEGQTRKFMVPTIEIDVTPAQLLAGKGAIAPPQVSGPVQRPQLEAGPRALEAGAPDYVALARQATDLDGVRAVWQQADAAGHMTPELDEQLRPIGDALARPDADGAVDAEVVGEPVDLTALWTQIVAAGGEKGMDMWALEADFREQTGMNQAEANATVMQSYLQLLTTGEQVAS